MRKFYFQLDPEIKQLLRSRKFWSLVIASAAIWTGFASNGITTADAIKAQVAAFAGYMIGTGLDQSPPAAR